MNKLKRTGLIRESFAIAIDVIVEHKLRSGLILLGVAIGVASLMGVVSILLGLKAGIVQEVGKYEQTVLTVQKYDYEISGMAEQFWHRKNVEPKHAKAIKQHCKSANYVAFMISSVVFAPTLHYKNEESRRVAITGAEPSMFYISTLEMEDGRMFTDSEVLHHAKVVILGHSPRRDMFPNIDPIGKKITINDKDFTIVGTLAARKTIGGDSSDNLALIPYTAFKDVISRNEMNMAQIMVSIREGHSLDEAREEIIQIMRVQRGLKANQDNDFSVATMDTALDLIKQITEPIELILVAISSIALLVGGIGVMNMMLVSVTERTAEIGIRKAVGANRRHILWQFLIEAGTLTGIGGVLGLALGLSIAFGISRVTDLPFSLSPIFIISAVAFSIAIGMFFGFYPAYRASNLNPIQAIEYAK